MRLLCFRTAKSAASPGFSVAEEQFNSIQFVLNSIRTQFVLTVVTASSEPSVLRCLNVLSTLFGSSAARLAARRLALSRALSRRCGSGTVLIQTFCVWGASLTVEMARRFTRRRQSKRSKLFEFPCQKLIWFASSNPSEASNFEGRTAPKRFFPVCCARLSPVAARSAPVASGLPLRRPRPICHPARDIPLSGRDTAAASLATLAVTFSLRDLVGVLAVSFTAFPGIFENKEFFLFSFSSDSFRSIAQIQKKTDTERY